MEQSERLELGCLWLIGSSEAIERGGMLAVCQIADLDLRLPAWGAEAVFGDVDRHAAATDVTSGARSQPRGSSSSRRATDSASAP